MDTTLLNRKFESIGARLQVVTRPPLRFRNNGLLMLNIGTDRKGEYFEITPPVDKVPEIDVLDVKSQDRHLLLMVREEGAKNKYLCGHDERHWFVAGIPEAAAVGTVRQAKEALQPVAVQNAVARHAVSGKARNRRKNRAFIRQGEWFFLPVRELSIDAALVLRNEPLRRGNGGKPHWAEFCYRTGGETVMVCGRYPNGLTLAQHKHLLQQNAKAKNWGWMAMQRNPGVYVRGTIRHSDHNTITLHGWHQVVMNTENQSRGMRNVAFLD